MAEIEKVMNIALDDIEKLMNIGGDDIEKVNDLEYVTEVVWYGSRGLSIGGTINSSPYHTAIEYKAITSTGNTADFGDVDNYGTYGNLYDIATGSNTSRGVFMGGYASNWSNNESAAAGERNYIHHITVGSLGNSTNAADLTLARKLCVGSTNGTTQLVAGGTAAGSNVVDYFTIASISNASDFGDLYAATTYMVGSINNATRAVFGTGYTSGDATGTGRMDYFTIASTGDASDFGDMNDGSISLGRSGNGGLESDTRGVFMGGRDVSATAERDYIMYITVGSTGDATDFGNLIAASEGSGSACTSNGTKGEAYGYYDTGRNDSIQSITIASAGNAADNGNLLDSTTQNGVLSGT